jgi:small basic protein
MKSKLTIAGLLIGGAVGFLLRPSVPLMGQLPFTTVITRGGNLRGLDQLLLGYARTSFNYLIAGIVVGAVIGLIAAFTIEKSRPPNTSVNP